MPIPQMSETFKFDVNYGTSFHDIERLRGKMLEFLKGEGRDFEPVFDVEVISTSFRLNYQPTFLSMLLIDISDQSKMTLSTDIKYRSNIQHDALKGSWSCDL
jgi:small-conductance mechanosensitive channel